MEKAKNTCIEMLTQREYTSVDIGNDFITATKHNGDTICVFLTLNSKLNTKCIQEYINLLYKLKYQHGIIIYENVITPSAKKIILNLPAEGKYKIAIELFSVKELQFNITQHYLQPSQFKRLEDDDAENFKKTYGINFPLLMINDPISRFYNYKVGDIIKVIRKDGFVSYRIVCEEYL